MSYASPRPATRSLPSPGSPRVPGQADLAMPASARHPVPVDPEAARIAQELQAARGRVARRHLADRLANPQRAQFSIPWEPAVPQVGGICSGCGVMVAADRRAGHAVQQATRFPRGQKERCVESALGITA